MNLIMLNNTLEIIKGSFATLGLVGIVMITAFTVSALNPRAYNPLTDTEVAGPTVQGLSSDSEYIKNVNLENNFSNNNEGVRTSLNKISNNEWEYIFEFKNGLAEDFASGEYKFLKFLNDSDISVKYNLELESSNILGSDVDLEISKGLDTINIGVQEKVIFSTNKNTEDILRIKFNTDTSINYPFNVKFLITF